MRKHLALLIVIIFAAGLVFTGCPDKPGPSEGPGSGTTYTVTFNGNADGDQVINLPGPIGNIKPGGSIKKPVQIPVRVTGFVFEKWVQRVPKEGDPASFDEIDWIFEETGIEGTGVVQNTILYAIWRELNTITVTEAENGQISVNKQWADEGDVVTVTVVPNTNWELKSVTVTRVPSGTVTVRDVTGEPNKKEFTMPAAAVTVTAVFFAEFSITIIPTAEGIVTVEKEIVEAGQTVNINVVPNDDVGLESITITGSGGNIEPDMTGDFPTFVMPGYDVIIIVTFYPLQTEIIYDFSDVTVGVGAMNGTSTELTALGFSMSGVNWWGGVYTSVPAYPGKPAWYNRKGAQVGGSGENVSVTKTGMNRDISSFVAAMPNVCVWSYIRGPMTDPRTFTLRLDTGAGAANQWTSSVYSIPLDPAIPAQGQNIQEGDVDSGWVRTVIPLTSFTSSGGNLATAANKTITGWRVVCVNGNINYWVSDIYLTNEAPGRYIMK